MRQRGEAKARFCKDKVTRQKLDQLGSVHPARVSERYSRTAEMQA